MSTHPQDDPSNVAINAQSSAQPRAASGTHGGVAPPKLASTRSHRRPDLVRRLRQEPVALAGTALGAVAILALVIQLWPTTESNEVSTPPWATLGSERGDPASNIKSAPLMGLRPSPAQTPNGGPATTSTESDGDDETATSSSTTTTESSTSTQSSASSSTSSSSTTSTTTTTTSTRPTTTTTTPAPSLGALRAQALSIINEKRAETECGQFTMVPQLNIAAQNHANEMSSSGSLTHIGSDGSGPWDRAVRAGYSPHRIAESVTKGTDRAAEALGRMFAHPIERNKVLDCVYIHLGVGYNHDGQYWTLVYAVDER